MVIEGAAEFRNQDGRTEGLFVAVLIERAGIDVVPAQASQSVRDKVQGDDPGLVVFKVLRALLVGYGVDSAAEIYQGLPSEVVALVVASRNINVIVAKPIWTITREIQPVPVGGKSGAGVVEGAVDVGSEVLRCSPGVFNACPL